jgi:phosphomannomutase / phosphoglucomutase
MSIFKACDIRGVYGRELTDEMVYRIGRSVGTMLGRKSVIVGGDVRTSTPSLKSALIGGLVESGALVIDIGIVPTPAFYFAKRHLDADAGVMVTASHNPPEFNGLKLALGPLPITAEELQRIRDLSEKGEFTSVTGGVRESDIIPSYISFIQSTAPRPAGVPSSKTIIDCGNGCYSGIAPDVFRRFGYQVEELFCTPDGTFPNRNPNSAVAEHLTALSSKMRGSGAALGIAFDGDGDRVSFVDERGRFLNSDKAIVILSNHILSDNTDQKVIYDLKCSSVVPEAISRARGIPVPERSGHAFIKTRMIAEDAAFGAELSGHYFYRELGGGDDGLYSALLMAGMLTRSGRSLSELADEVPEYATTPDIRVPYEGDRHEVIERIASAFSPDSVSRLDGVRVVFPCGWALARVSVTEPVITLRFEAADEAGLNQIMKDFLDPVAELRYNVESRSFHAGRAEFGP